MRGGCLSRILQDPVGIRSPLLFRAHPHEPTAVMRTTVSFDDVNLIGSADGILIVLALIQDTGGERMRTVPNELTALVPTNLPTDGRELLVMHRLPMGTLLAR